MKITPKRTPKKLVVAQGLLEGLISRLGFQADHYAVFEAWDRLLGSREAAKARAVGFQKSRLVVEVDSSVRLHDLTFRRPGLLKKLNGHFGTDRPISDIIFRLSSNEKKTTGKTFDF